MPCFSVRNLATVLLATTGALALAAGCSQNAPSPAAPTAAPVSPAVASAVFVGSAACAECHALLYERQNHTRHALTLRRVSRQSLGDLTPPAGGIKGTGLSLAEGAGQFELASILPAVSPAPLDYALGSGKTGMTYVSVASGTTLAEARMSYFPHLKKWYTTPGQEQLPLDVLGVVHSTEFSRKCLLCHAVTLPANSLQAEERFFGVGCESCHGAGSSHIAAMRSGKRGEGQMEKLAAWPASRLDALCGRCHIIPKEAQSGHTTLSTTSRFQMFVLTQSQCFQQSRDTLSCITCHDPHTDVSTNAKSYETVCLSCHTSTPSTKRPAPLQTVAIKVCPVNQKDKCIGCHMPKRHVMDHTQIPTMIADHDIRVYKEKP